MILKYPPLFFGTLFLLLLNSPTVQAQESINSSGSNATGNGGALNYSVGQLVYSTYHGSGGTIAEGVQQPYEISELGIDEMLEKNISITLYPNPTSDQITLEIKDLSFQKLKFQLFDIQGKLLNQQKITQFSSAIPFQDLSKGIYFLNILQEETRIKAFKIIKN